ncbi:MAG: hypothetical protein F4179_04380 [Gammaproteobacteria bacterium]|nr:hypothetical protein [Gammaproteobacteria bacterium]MYD00054.1 hypothetical protein [Gammaproteobacteria bacterium]MYF60900.1 hypothetical protein [Gammaproteobacteria bacterium]MYI21597.1 hypothetical protein [Gammaproteobacteria bacterium]
MKPGNPVQPFRRRSLQCRLRVLLALALPLATGCYTYTQVGVETVAPGEAVRLRVFEQAVDRLPAQLERRTQVEGTVVDLDAGRLNLLPELGSVTTEPVAFALSDIAAISRRELNRTRTWLAAGVGAALGVGLLLSIEGDPAGTSGGPITEFMTGWSLPLSR